MCDVIFDCSNRNGRAEGSLLLKRELENSAEEKFGQLLPYIGSFIKFLGGLLVSILPTNI